MAKASGEKSGHASYAAMLRAINVGGHRVGMKELGGYFEQLGFSNVSTILASGNVLFHAHRSDEEKMADLIARELRKGLGYEVATFLRTPRQMADIVANAPLAESGKQTTLYVAFLHRPLDAATKKRLLALGSEADRLGVNGREVYWLSDKGFARSDFSAALLEKTIQAPATFRNITTVRRLAEKLAEYDRS